MNGNAGTPSLVSNLLLDVTTPPKGVPSPAWSDLKLIKGANTAAIPRAFYYGQWNEASNGISARSPMCSASWTTIQTSKRSCRR